METQRSCCLPYLPSVHSNGNGVVYQHILHRVAAPMPSPTLTQVAPPGPFLATPPPPPDFEVDDLLDFPTDYDSTEVLDSLASSPKVLLSELEPSLKHETLAASAYATQLTASNSAPISAPIASTADAKTIPEAKPAAAAAAPSSSSAGAGLCNLPPDELATELEWLSGFNEDSSYTVDTKLVSLVNSTGIKDCEFTPVKAQEKRESFFIQSPISVLEQSPGSFRVSRPKRSRTARNGSRVWSLDILKPRHKFDKGNNPGLLITKSSSSELLWSSFNQEAPEKPAKKPKKQSSSLNSQDASQIRRCSHCLVQKTPQWRAGPLGPKTLCNACGVRYKSGRLLPEYRPASSPTFLSEVHSNSHRRILEMRRAKELEAQVAVPNNVKCGQVQDEDCVSETEQCKASPSNGNRSDFRDETPTSKEVSSACVSCTLSGQSTICDETSVLMSEVEANENTNPVCYDEITSSEQVTVRSKEEEEEGSHEQDSMTSQFVEENHEECKGTQVMIGIGSNENMK